MTIRIPIQRNEIEEAKAQTIIFDEQKIYDKFQCRNNYIGLLGEIVFDRWMTENKIPHEWVEFTKKDWNSPDFIIQNQTIDLKTTYDIKMWIQKPSFDRYIYARVNEDLNELFVLRATTGIKLQKLIDRNLLEIVVRGNRKDYVVEMEKMGYIDKELIKEWFP